MHKTLYRVGIDFEAFNDDLQRVGVHDLAWYNIVETFVEYHESVSEVVQLLSVSAMCPDNTRDARFLKAVFASQGDMRLRAVTPRVYIGQDEYYEKLLASQAQLMETKMRLQCSIAKNVTVSVERHLESGFTVLQFEHDDDVTADDILRQFPSIRWSVLEDLTIEEAFWEFSSKMMKEREQKALAFN